MNQILDKFSNNHFHILNSKKLLFIIISLTLSISLLYLIFSFILGQYQDFKKEKSSIKIYQTLKIMELYNTKESNDIYLCTIYIDKLNLKYPVFNYFTYDNLKIAPCRFSGNFQSNLCIVGHNYNDNRFFGKLFDLTINDSIVLEDFKRNKTYL